MHYRRLLPDAGPASEWKTHLLAGNLSAVSTRVAYSDPCHWSAKVSIVWSWIHYKSLSSFSLSLFFSSKCDTAFVFLHTACHYSHRVLMWKPKLKFDWFGAQRLKIYYNIFNIEFMSIKIFYQISTTTNILVNWLYIAFVDSIKT